MLPYLLLKLLINNHNQAISDFTKAIILDPKNEKYYKNRFESFKRNNKLSKLDEQFERKC